MSEIMATLRPRRGTRQAAIDNNIILKSGEIYFEVPADGVGTGKGNIVIGNGTSAYADLPYFATNVTVNDTLTSTSSTEALSAKQGKVLLDRIAELEETVTTLQTQLSELSASLGDQVLFRLDGQTLYIDDKE